MEAINQPIAPGSHARVAATPRLRPGRAVTWTALVWSGGMSDGQAVIAAHDDAASLVLAFGADGVCVMVDGTMIGATGSALRPQHWYRVWIGADSTTGLILVGQQPLDGGPPVTTITSVPGLALPSGGPLLLGARDPSAPTDHYTGKLEDPAILSGSFRDWSEPGDQAEITPATIIAAWDFSREMSSQSAIDVGPYGCHGHLVNPPPRAMAGARWSGKEMCWRHAPRDYAAIHFHADDLGDCLWEPTLSWTVPEDLPSGADALHLSCQEGEEWLRLYVLPKRSGPFAPIAFLASTFTYQAYANHARGTRPVLCLDIRRRQ